MLHNQVQYLSTSNNTCNSLICICYHSYCIFIVLLEWIAAILWTRCAGTSDILWHGHRPAGQTDGHAGAVGGEAEGRVRGTPLVLPAFRYSLVATIGSNVAITL